MLTLQQVSKTFNAGTANEHTALRQVDLHIQKGEFVIIVGSNGSGKSTLLNTVAGALPIDQGSISIDKADVTALPEHRRACLIGRVFQDPMMGTASHMTIAENLALAKRRGQRRTLRSGITAAERREQRDLLAQLDLGLENRLTTQVSLLSGGQRQAVTLLMAAMQQPKLLLLDEHTAALDPKTAAKVLSLSAQIVKDNRLTTLMITHNMADAALLGDRLLMMSEGRFICDIQGEEKRRMTASELLLRFVPDPAA